MHAFLQFTAALVIDPRYSPRQLREWMSDGYLPELIDVLTAEVPTVPYETVRERVDAATIMVLHVAADRARMIDNRSPRGRPDTTRPASPRTSSTCSSSP